MTLKKKRKTTDTIKSHGCQVYALERQNQQDMCRHTGGFIVAIGSHDDGGCDVLGAAV